MKTKTLTLSIDGKTLHKDSIPTDKNKWFKKDVVEKVETLCRWYRKCIREEKLER